MNRVTGFERMVALVVLVLSLLGIYVGYQVSASLFTPPPPEQPVYSLVTQPKGGPDYPVPVSKAVDYWAVNCTSYVSQETIVKTDEILERLNADHIVQTMFLCMPADQITDGVEYITRFQDYMELGLAEGPRRDNGLAYLMAFSDEGIRVNYSVGQGATALQPWELRGLADIAQQESDPDLAMIGLAQGIDEYARSLYEPYEPVEPVMGAPSTPDSGNAEGYLVILLCGGFLALILVTEPVFAVATLLGSYGAYQAMAWPIMVLGAIADGSGSTIGGGGGSYSSSRRSGGSSLGGGGGRGGRSGGGGGGRTGRGG